MKLMKTGLTLLLAIVLTACSGLTGYMDTSDKKLEGEGVTLSQIVTNKDLYGVWAIATDDGDPNDVTLIFAFYTDHTGLVYVVDKDAKTKTEYTSAKFFKWKFDEANKELHSAVFKQIEHKKGQRTEKKVDDRDVHKIDLYRLDNEKFAIKLYNKKQRLLLLRMPNDTYNNLLKIRPDLPKLK